MLSRRRIALTSTVYALLALIGANHAQGEELDKFLPPDTEIFLRINLRQVLDAKPVKARVGEVQELLKQIDDVGAALKDLDFDPFTDLDTITVAAPNSNEPDRMLVIVHGKFKLDKFKAKGDEVAKSMDDVLKLHKVADGAGGQAIVYEVRIPDQDQPLFVALPNATTLLVSPGKDYVADAIKSTKSKTPVTLKNKNFQALLAKMDQRQSVALAAVGEALAKGAGDEAAKDVLAKVDALGGGFTLAEDLKLELVVGAKTAQAAKELKETIDDGVTKGLTLLGLLAVQEKKLAPLVDVLKTVRCTAKEKAVTVKAEITAEVMAAIQKALSGE